VVKRFNESSVVLGNMQEQSSQFIIGESGKKYTLEDKVKEESGKELNLKEIPTVYFKNCRDSEYTINHRITKLLIEDCHNTTITINRNILTSTMEVWRCENLVLQVNDHVKTLQLDLMKGVKVHYQSKNHMQNVIWQHVEDFELVFGDDPESSCKTGFAQMKETHPDSDIKIDQFITRFLENGVSHERGVRLKNGFLSTEREAADWDRRNEAARDRYMTNFMKEGGIHLNKADVSKKIPRNNPCPCGSKHKYKKCCEGKKEISGLASGQQKKTYK